MVSRAARRMKPGTGIGQQIDRADESLRIRGGVERNSDLVAEAL